MNNKIEKAIEKIVKKYSNIETELLSIIAEHFKINDEFINSDYWRLQKLDEMGLLNNEIVEYLTEATSTDKEDILNAINNIGYDSLNLNKLETVYKNNQISLNPETLKANHTIQSIINYAYNDVSNHFVEISKKVENATREAYLNVIEDVYLKTTMGTHSYQEAIRSAINDLSNQGIKTLVYKTTDVDGNITGIRNYDIESAVRRDLLTSARQLSGNVSQEVIKELNCEYVYISEHLRCRPTHFDWQGTIVKTEDFAKITRYGEVDGIYGVNCGHYAEAYFGDARGDELKNISKEDATNAYNLSQKQRYLERGIRKWKRKAEMYKASEDTEYYEKCQNKVKEWQLRTKEFTEENKLNRDYTREYVGTKSNQPSNVGINLFDKNKYQALSEEDYETLRAKQNIDASEKEILYNIDSGYIGTSNSFEINEKLRTSGYASLSASQKEVVDTLDRVISNNYVDKNIIAKRRVNLNYIDSEFDFNLNEALQKDMLVDEMKAYIGDIKQEKGFMSCSLTSKKIIDGNVELNMYISKGTNLFITNNVEESEAILNYNTRYIIRDVREEINEYNEATLIMDVEIMR